MARFLRQVDEVEVVPARPLQGQAGGRRQADQGLDARAQNFLNQFQAAAAGNNRQAAVGRNLLADQRANQFIQSVMPTDVFATHQQFALAIHKHCRMHGTAVLDQGLECADTLAQAIEPLRRRQGRAGQYLEVGQCLLHRFHATEAAAAGARQLAALLLEVPERAAGHLYLSILGSP